MSISNTPVWDVIIPASHIHLSEETLARLHQELADKIVNICGGLTAVPGMGRWKNPKTGCVDDDEVVVYRFTADYATARIFAFEVKTMFEQESVAFYKVSDEMEFI